MNCYREIIRHFGDNNYDSPHSKTKRINENSNTAILDFSVNKEEINNAKIFLSNNPY